MGGTRRIRGGETIVVDRECVSDSSGDRVPGPLPGGRAPASRRIPPKPGPQVVDARYRSLFEQVRDGVLVVRHGRIVAANPAVCALLGYSEEELRRLPPSRILTVSEDRRAIHEGWAERGEVAGQEVLLTRRDGQSVPVRVTARPCGEGSRRDVEVLVLVQDLRERRNLERQLLHSQKMDALGRLAGGLAHDFKNLLSVTLGWVEVLGESIPSDDPRHAGLDEIVASLERARNLTRQLLSVSRQRSDVPRLLDLNEILGHMDGTLRQVLGRGIDLRVHLEPGLPLVRVDPARLEQILLNLVVNAREAMPRGGILQIRTASIWLGRAASGVGPGLGRCVRLSIQDSGCGIPAPLQARVFEPFFTTKRDGSGLGLSAVHSAVRQAGGEVRLHSAPGQGARFEVDLPAAGPVAPRSPVGRQAGRRSSRGGTILLVDDDPVFRSLVAGILESGGHRVLQADGADEALAHCATKVRIDLLVSDVCMPGVGGPDLARRVRALRPAVPVLFTSGLDQASLEPVRDLPRVDFLEKPFRKRSLLARVQALLESPVPVERVVGGL